MKKLWTPCSRFARTRRSTSSALRTRDLRPCTLMIVQKLHRNGQPRPASKLVRMPLMRRDTGQHRETAAHMKAADANRNAGGAERPRNVNRARKLIGLNADQTDKRATSAGTYLPNDFVGSNARIRFIPRRDLDLDR